MKCTSTFCYELSFANVPRKWTSLSHGTFALLLMVSMCGVDRVIGSPALLSSWRLVGEGNVFPSSDPQLELILELPATFGAREIVGPGIGTYWQDDEVGTVDFTHLTDPFFDGFARSVTNGTDEIMFAWNVWRRTGGGFVSRGFGNYESRILGGSPDFVGFELELVRLNVLEMDIRPWTTESGIPGYEATYEIEYGFYGSIVPEPCPALLMTGYLCFIFPQLIQLRTGGRRERDDWRRVLRLSQ